MEDDGPATVEQMMRFYRSPEGQAYLAQPDQILADLRFVGGPLGGHMAEVRAPLPAISWRKTTT